MNREKRKLVECRTGYLLKSDKTFKSIYYGIFLDKERIFGQYTENGRIVKVTFGELQKLIMRYAYYINKNVSEKHKFIGLDSENCVSWVAAFWGILLSGNKPFLINCRQPEPFKASMVKNLGVEYIIGSKKHDLGAEYGEFCEIEKETAEKDEEDINISDEYFENEMALSTSATSMNETICVFNGEEISNSILNAEYVLRNNKRMPQYYRGALRQLAFLPFYHIFGFSAVYLWFTYYGCTMVFLKDYSGDTIMKTVRQHMVTHIFAVPLLWNTMEAQIKKQVKQKGQKTADKFEKACKISEKIQGIAPYFGEAIAKSLFKEITQKTLGKSIKFCISGGAPLRESTVLLFNSLGYPLHNGFGMTETGITSVNLEKKLKGRVTGSVGIPFPSVSYATDDEGVLTISGNSLCSYRIINGERVETNGVFVTGDIAKKDENGYYILGRKNDLIIGENGENINPDIAEKNFTVPFSQRFCIVEDVLGRKGEPALVVELKKICSQSQIAQTVEAVRTQNDGLPMTVRMKNIYFTYDMISSPQAIKVSRNYLKNGVKDGSIKLLSEKDLGLASENREEFDDKSALAEIIRDIIAETLNINREEVLPDANVMTDLGGSSLDYFYIISQIGEKTGITLYTDESRCPYSLKEFCREAEEQM